MAYGMLCANALIFNPINEAIIVYKRFFFIYKIEILL